MALLTKEFKTNRQNIEKGDLTRKIWSMEVPQYSKFQTK